MSCAEYYKTRYNEEIKNLNQPLMINKDRGTWNEIALIPELCQLTRLADTMRANFNLMKDLAGILNTNAEAKIKEIKNLMTHFMSNARCVEKQKLGHLSVNENPQRLKGFKCDAGNLIMGPGASGVLVSFDIEKNAREIDCKAQGKMFTQTELKTHGDRDAHVVNQFESIMEEYLKTSGYQQHADDEVMRFLLE